MSNHFNEQIKEKIEEHVMSMSVLQFINNIETLDDNECMLGSGVVDATVLNHRRQVAGLNDLVKKLINKLYEEYEND